MAKLSRLFDLLEYQKENHNLNVCLGSKVEGDWKTYSTNEVIEMVDALSRALLKKGIKKEDKVAIVSENRPEWNLIDFALQQIGAISVPMYPTITEKDYHYILNESETKLVFVSNQDLFNKVSSASKELSTVENIVSFDLLKGVDYWEMLLDLGRQHSELDLKSHKENVKTEDLLTLIYTSGTTGNPKGVMLTHSNVLSNAIAVSDNLSAALKIEKCLSFLPLCHIFERTSVYFYFYRGVSIYYAENLETIGDNLKEIQPDMFTTVPRLLEKIYDKIVAKGLELSGVKKSLFFWALELGHKFKLNEDQGFWYNQKLKIANKLIFSKWRAAVGGNIKIIASGGAALQKRLATIFWSAGIPILEAYGLTETSPGISFNRYDSENIMLGTVGPALPGVTIKIAEDGEICVKGPNVMKGYYKQPEKTKAVIDEEGWFHTGDIGELVNDKFLKITDRKKEMFKTSGGKYVAPQLIENKFKESIFFEQVLVVGEGQKHPSALIVPNFESIKDYCEHKSIPYQNEKTILENEQIQDKLKRELEKLNQSFAQWEKVKTVNYLTTPWTVENGELTAKLSLKRKIIERNYEKEIAALYH